MYSSGKAYIQMVRCVLPELSLVLHDYAFIYR